MDALVVLPDHLHCVWSLADGDTDYSTHWGLIKAKFSRAIEPRERRSASQLKRGERGIWNGGFGNIAFVMTRTLRVTWITSTGIR